MFKKPFFWIVLAVVGAILYLKRKTVMKSFDVWTELAKVVPQFEGFSSNPYWDVSRWSWGYGTRVPNSIDDKTKKPSGSISKIQAVAAMVAHLHNDFSYLDKLVKVQLDGRQWAALLSFSYNEGQGNADNLVANINASQWSALEKQWKAYNKARNDKGVLVVSKNLTDRRSKEWEIFKASII